MVKENKWIRAEKWSNLPSGSQRGKKIWSLSFYSVLSLRLKMSVKQEIPLFVHRMKIIVFVRNILHKENKLFIFVLLLQGWGLFAKSEPARKLVLLSHFKLGICNCLVVLYETIFCSQLLNIIEILIVYKVFKTFRSILRHLQYWHLPCFMHQHGRENLPDWNFPVYVVTWAQRDPKPGVSIGVLWQYLQWSFTTTAGFIFPVSIMEMRALWRAWGVGSGVRYLRPFSHSTAVWVILYCVKKKKKIEED